MSTPSRRRRAAVHSHSPAFAIVREPTLQDRAVLRGCPQTIGHGIDVHAYGPRYRPDAADPSNGAISSSMLTGRGPELPRDVVKRKRAVDRSRLASARLARPREGGRVQRRSEAAGCYSARGMLGSNALTMTRWRGSAWRSILTGSQ